MGTICLLCSNERNMSANRGKKEYETVKDFFKKLKSIQVNFWCTDAWKAFKEVFPLESHLMGKRFSKVIEGVNTSLRNVCKRLIRRTTTFSKKLINHWCAVKLVMVLRNLSYHTQLNTQPYFYSIYC